MKIAKAVLRSYYRLLVEGGPGSGNFRHSGRPGEVGGSGSGGGKVQGGVTGAEKIEPHVVEDIYGRNVTVTDWPANWGLSAGTYITYRGGNLNSPRGIFFAPDKSSAENYAGSSDIKAEKYLVTIKNPVIFKHIIDALVEVTGKSRDWVLRSRDRAQYAENWWRAADKKIADSMRKKGHDAIIYTRPAAPALREMNYLGSKQNIKLVSA